MTRIYKPVCSVITATWHRHDLLFNRAIPSVLAQTYSRIEHIIVSDGPDPELDALMAGRTITELAQGNIIRGSARIHYLNLPLHDPAEHWGHLARRYALKFAQGDIITYCDDDDELRPDHCALMVDALQANPDASFAVSRMLSHGNTYPTEIGRGPLGAGNLGTPMVAHRKEALTKGNWDKASFTEDWDLVEKWLDAGLICANVDAITADVYPSVYR